MNLIHLRWLTEKRKQLGTTVAKKGKCMDELFKAILS